FLDLRDRDGIVQVAVGPAWAPPEMLARAGTLGAETVIVVDGVVVARPANMKNAELATRDVEVHARRLEVVGVAATPAIPVARAKDEDLRNDRQPEFTQIDLEASFVGMDDVLQYVEAVLVALWEEAGHAVTRPFSRLRWQDAMERFGTDKPDLRYELAIQDWTAAVEPLAVPFFQSARQNGVRVRGLALKGGGALSRKDADQLAEAAKQLGGAGL